MERHPKDIEHDLSHIATDQEEMPSQRRSPYWFILGAIFLSLLVHLTFLALGALVPEYQIPAEPQEKRTVRTHLVQRALQKPPPEKSRQVVEIAPPEEQRKPDNPDYLAEYDSSVKEQTRARETSAFADRVSSKPSGLLGQKSAQSQTREQTKPQKQESPRIIKSDNGLLAKKPKENPEQKFLPSWKGDGMVGGMPSNDYLRNVQIDNETKLNAAEGAHATFFVRVKKAIARRWDPNKAIRRNDPTGHLLGTQDRTTQVSATIDKEGRLLAIKVIRESGIYFLDDEALNAFKGAAPFSNPPKALFAHNDTFEFPFGFVLSYDRGFKFDLDWKPY